jgi:ferredoxin-NADP reductase
MKEYRYFIKKTEKPALDVVVLELADIRGVPIFDFKPGQYVMICYRNKKGHMEEKHAFSIASSPMKKDSLRLGIKIMGKFTTGLSQLKAGQEIFVMGPFGNFVFDEKKYNEIVFIAGGIGITPFISTLQYACDKKLPNSMGLLYSNKNLKGTTFMNELLEMEENNVNITSIFSVTEEKISENSNKIINGRITPLLMKKFVGKTKGKTFFICGPVPFMDAMKKNLSEIGVLDFQIEMEEFSMLPDDKAVTKLENLWYALTFSAVLFVLSLYIIYQSVSNSIINSNNSATSSINTNTSTVQPQAVGGQSSVSTTPSKKTRVS